MTDIDFYVQFRLEIERMYAPYVLNECETIRIEDEKTEIGILLIKDKYVVGLYILPEYRRKGYGRKAILDYVSKYGMLKDLTILNSNETAKSFWNDLFELEVIKENSIDTYYSIKSLKYKEV